MRRILQYLDEKAQQVKQNEPTDPAPYATAPELAKILNARLDCVCKALRILQDQKRIRVYPKSSPERRNRKYGSLVLPEVSYEQVYGVVAQTIMPLMSRISMRTGVLSSSRVMKSNSC